MSTKWDTSQRIDSAARTPKSWRMKTFSRNYVLITLLVLNCAAIGAESAEPITPSKRVELFNGTDLTGWAFTLRTNVEPASVWSVKDGILSCVGKPGGYMRTEQSYRNYKLTVEWRFTKPGNTGVLVHINGPDRVWPRSFECQGMHDRQGDFWLWGGAECKEPRISDKKNGVAMTAPSNEKPVGEWNTYQVECNTNSIKILVNGKLMNTATECNLTSGMIGLQSEGGAIEVRKVYLEPLGL